MEIKFIEKREKFNEKPNENPNEKPNEKSNEKSNEKWNKVKWKNNVKMISNLKLECI